MALAALALTQPAARAAFFWTNTVTGNWSSAANWTNDTGAAGAPIATGQSNYILNFTGTGTYAATHDFNNGFLINQLNLGGPTLTLAGNSMAFTNNGATLPLINQNSASTITSTNPIKLAANTTFGGTGNGGVTFQNLISGTGSLTKNGSGALTLAYGTNTYSGGTTISAGSIGFAAFSVNTTTSLGTGPVTVNSGATLACNRTYLPNSITFNSGTVSSGNSFASTLAGPITLGATPTLNITGGFSITGNVSGPGGIIKTGGSTVPLSGSNSFTGALVVNAGAFSAASFNSVSGGTPTSNLGAPTNAANGTISLGSTTTAASLIYTGTGETTDRILKLAGTTGGATITQSGTPAGLATTCGQSGLLKFTSNISVPGTTGVDNRKTLTLTQVGTTSTGSTPGAGEISGSIGDSLLGTAGQLATSVTKAGPGTWTLSGTNTYTGTTRVQSGKLVCTRASALGTGALEITDGSTKLQLDFAGVRQVASLILNGVAQPNGTYGSSISLATTKDDIHFAGPGAVVIGPLSSTYTNTLALTSGSNPSTAGTTLTFTATVTGSSQPNGSVVFYDGLVPFGTNALNGSAQAAFSTSVLTGGVHTITAVSLG